MRLTVHRRLAFLLGGAIRREVGKEYGEEETDESDKCNSLYPAGVNVLPERERVSFPKRDRL